MVRIPVGTGSPFFRQKRGFGLGKEEERDEKKGRRGEGSRQISGGVPLSGGHAAGGEERYFPTFEKKSVYGRVGVAAGGSDGSSRQGNGMRKRKIRRGKLGKLSS